MLIILFLDFDGVMHAVNQRDLFCREDHLARVLRDFQNVEIVISSAWRETHTLTTMRKFFLTDLRDRIVGVTPIIEVDEADTCVAPAVRFCEIQKYLADTDNRRCRWVALDDDPTLFQPLCASLVLCDGRNGFAQAQEFALREMLAGLEMQS